MTCIIISVTIFFQARQFIQNNHTNVLMLQEVKVNQTHLDEALATIWKESNFFITTTMKEVEELFWVSVLGLLSQLLLLGQILIIVVSRLPEFFKILFLVYILFMLPIVLPKELLYGNDFSPIYLQLIEFLGVTTTQQNIIFIVARIVNPNSLHMNLRLGPLLKILQVCMILLWEKITHSGLPGAIVTKVFYEKWEGQIDSTCPLTSFFPLHLQDTWFTWIYQ